MAHCSIISISKHAAASVLAPIVKSPQKHDHMHVRSTYQPHPHSHLAIPTPVQLHVHIHRVKSEPPQTTHSLTPQPPPQIWPPNPQS